VDTAFYTPGEFHFAQLLDHPIITPLNNLKYNSDPSNLALHGVHPWYQHGLINLAQFLGPAFPLLLFLRKAHITPMVISALSGTALLSLFSHQEARFLLPVVPLLLSSVPLPSSRFKKVWIAAWVIFNLAMGVLMGVYHQGGIVPVQMHIAKTEEVVSTAFWWKTYSPPIWLLNGKNENLTTVDLMGMPREEMLGRVKDVLPTCRTAPLASGVTYLIAPRSAGIEKTYTDNATQDVITLDEVWSYSRHLNLDDMDFAEDGVWKTLGRVVGDRGLVVWRVQKKCGE